MGRAIYVNIDFLEPNAHITLLIWIVPAAIVFRKATLSFWTATGNSPLHPGYQQPG